MNLFILDRDPVKAAVQNCDSHVRKIILEACQLLYHAHYSCVGHFDTDCQVRAMSHYNNHISKWVRASTANYKWTADHCVALCDEFYRRFKKKHSWHDMALFFQGNVPNLPSNEPTPFALGVAEELKSIPDPVEAYREFYCKYKDFATWSDGAPDWYKPAIC